MERGHDVRILTAFPNYPTGIVPEEYRGRFFAREEYKGIKVYRSYIYETPNSGFFKRLIAQLSFAFSSFLAFIRIKNEFHPEMSVVESPPLFAAFTAILMRFLFGVRYIFNVADIWPDAAVDLGMLKNTHLIRLAEMLEMAAYYFSDAVVTVTRGFFKDIVRKGVPSGRVFLLPNGVDTAIFSPERAGNDEEFIRRRAEFFEKFGLEGKFVVLCAGTLGLSHKIELLLEVAKRFKGNDKIKFLVVGDGSEREKLMRMASEYGLENVCFERMVPKAVMPALVSLADVCVCSLLDTPSFRGRILARTYEYLAMGKPILMFASGEMAALVQTAKAGLASHPDDIDAAVENLGAMFGDNALRDQMGANAIRFVSRNFSRDIICDRWEILFKKCRH